MTELVFKGKEFVWNHHLAVPFRPLVMQPEKGIGEPRLDGNLIVQGDNLHALKALLPMYAGKVACIFIDPPYNTGNEGWCYNDNVNAPMIKEWLNSNPVGIDDGLRHDKWCAMMWPRLRLLRDLLSDEGLIFATIDDNEAARLRQMMDEVFGEENFVANFVWQSKDTAANNVAVVSETHNHVLCYALDASFAPSLIERTKDQNETYQNPDSDPRGPWLGSTLTRGEFRERDFYAIKNKKGRDIFPPTGSSWRRPPDKMKFLQEDNRIWWGANGDGTFQKRRNSSPKLRRVSYIKLGGHTVLQVAPAMREQS